MAEIKATWVVSDLKDNYYKTGNYFVDNSSNLSSPAFRIYSIFKRMINEKNNGDEVWPSYSKLQKLSGLSRRTIAKVINELVQTGWIAEIDKQFNDVNHYHINDYPVINANLVTKRGREKFALGQKVNQGRAKFALGVGQKVNSNKTNITRLINNTSDLKIKNLEDEIVEIALKEDNEENRKLLRSLAQSLREEKYRKSIGLP